MNLGGADVSFFGFLFWGQPDSGLICLVSFSFEFSFGGEEGMWFNIEKMIWSVPNKDTSR